MNKAIFVSYKHKDNLVYSYDSPYRLTARAYVDYLSIKLKDKNHIYKGEGNEDLSEFKDATIQTHLKDKIYYSSVTIVFISKGMKDPLKPETDQFIPWEISYSLKEITRDGITSKTNAMLAVVLPDENGSYEYFITERHCISCHVSLWWNTGTLFKILGKNMFNKNNPNLRNCFNCSGRNHTDNDHSYIHPVKWGDFMNNIDYYINHAVGIQERQYKNDKEYNITKEIPM